MAGDTILETRNLTKVFKDFWCRDKVRAVDDLNIKVNSGEVFGLLGPNGSGKSTMVKLALGLLRPTKGFVAVFGRPPGGRKNKGRGKIICFAISVEGDKAWFGGKSKGDRPGHD